MAIKALFIFNNAMALMDEVGTNPDSEGRYVPNDNDTIEYRARSIQILNILAEELYQYSDTYKEAPPGKRSIVNHINSLDETFDLDDYITMTVLPYGLAAHLLLQEDQTAANFFQQRYDELKAGLMRGMPAESTDTVDVYGGGYYEDILDENGNPIGRKYIAFDPIGFSGGGRWI